jgi:aminopeptidase N
MPDAALTPQTILLGQYSPPDWAIPEIHLDFALHETATIVTARMQVRRIGAHALPLRLAGDGLELVSASLDGQVPGPDDLALSAGGLDVTVAGEHAELTIVTRLNPSANTKLMGLYMSGGNFCTQCEAEGFRRITYFLDRPDVMSRYTVRLAADKTRFPVLLANGNLMASGEGADGSHWAEWTDPHPKPCYLFACVAGDLSPFSDTFTTASGKQVALAIYVAENDVQRCAHAMASLKASMAWDEEKFGREYDLEVFNIVAVHDFNFGAMENKGLNIFNAKYILADSDTATDADFDAVEAVVAHEYFHNWTGNRITCRDWFQLSLKEGLTVYRDQEFSADMGSRGLKRIEDVRVLRAAQFPEDASPLAHPVRPESYIEIANFYTATVYNKGAEVIRMMATLLGPDKFRTAMDVYFDRHDGQAVTCEDFIRCMEDGGGIDLAQFRLWYSQAGTPRLAVQMTHDAAAQTASVHIDQHVPETAGQPDPKPMHMPVRLALYSLATGKTLLPDTLVELRDARTSVHFSNIAEKPVLSFLRGFSAPVRVERDDDRDSLARLAVCDDDAFGRYEAVQNLAMLTLKDQIASKSIAADPVLIEAFSRTLKSNLDAALVAEALLLPSEAYIGDQMSTVDADGIHCTRQALRKTLSTEMRDLWQDAYHAHAAPVYARTPHAKGQRKLRNLALQYLMAGDDHEATALCYLHYKDATNMTDRLAALASLANSNAVERLEVLEDFYQRYRTDPAIIDKWFGLQAMSTRTDTLAQVMQLSHHPDFTIANPNRVRALIGGFGVNQVRLHAGDGAGYRFLVEQVLAVDKLNPQTAARLITPLGRWRRFDSGRAQLMRKQLENLVAHDGLSKDLFEIASKSL